MNNYWPDIVRTSTNKFRVFTAAICLSAALIGSPSVLGISISFEAEDLTDIVVGEDLWKFTYHVTGDFLLNQAFSLEFDETLYANLADVSHPSDWNVYILQPDPILGIGFYDAISKGNPGSLLDPFVLNAVWLGSPGTTPSHQPFTLLQYAADEIAILGDPLGGGTTQDPQGTTTGGTTGGTTGSTVPDAGSSLMLSLLAIGSLVGARKFFGALSK